MYNETIIIVFNDAEVQRCGIFKELGLKIWFSEIGYQESKSSRKEKKERKQAEKSGENNYVCLRREWRWKLPSWGFLM